MLRSMTGFGAAAGIAGEREVRVEIRSVNHRHLQVKTRLPHELAFLEGDVEGRVKKKLKRGAVTVSVNAATRADAAGAALNLEVAEHYRAKLAELSRRFGGNGTIPIEAVLPLPGVVGFQDDPAELEREARGVLKRVDEALGKLVEMREAEGGALEADLRKNDAEMLKLLDRIDRRMPTVVRAHQKNLRKRVGELLDGHAVDDAELAREIALLADKLDVSEEIARLRSHAKQLASFLDKGGDVGRKLDFLVQEILRETNTIGSKCNDAKVAHWVVELKTRIERLREQVQNVE